ncbi:MAG: glycosyltransferase [Bacteroidota bacterium]
MEQVTGIIVSYNTRNLLCKCVESIRKFYPTMKLIIIDGSKPSDPCYYFARSLINYVTKVHSVNRNIGHGEGMNLGISKCESEYFLLIDSDTVINGNIIPEMLDKIKNSYGVGQVVNVDNNGMNTDKGIKYLHPYFALINKDQYFKYLPIIHHGAPMINSMIDINKKKKSKLLIDFPVEKYVKHLGRGTRALNPKDFHPKHWDKITV